MLLAWALGALHEQQCEAFLFLLGKSMYIGHAGLLDNVLSDYLWARAVLLVGKTFTRQTLMSRRSD